jgi:hypothetical protein
MSTPSPSLSDGSSNLSRDLETGCKVGFLVLTAILAYAAIYLSRHFFSLNVSNVLNTFLKDSTLPATLRVAEAGKSVWLPLSCLLTLSAAGAGLFIRRPLRALLAISGCNLGLAIISIFLATALLDGFGKIVSSLG